MQQGYTHLTIILDRTGSMAPIRAPRVQHLPARAEGAARRGDADARPVRLAGPV
jgi:hypothetical protein